MELPQTFGRWTVFGEMLRPHGRKHSSRAKRHFVARCECGTEKRVVLGELRRGKTQSCGCLAAELTALRSTSHGASVGGRVTPEFRSWSAMKNRCLSPTSKDFAQYGGRGIAVCARWMAFENFLADMGPRPKGTTLDRIDNAGNYEPGNVRWATPTTQTRNRRNARLVTARGETRSIVEWAAVTGRSYNAIWLSLKNGATPEAAVFG
jgi:hypothetical protein